MREIEANQSINDVTLEAQSPLMRVMGGKNVEFSGQLFDRTALIGRLRGSCW